VPSFASKGAIDGVGDVLLEQVFVVEAEGYLKKSLDGSVSEQCGTVLNQCFHYHRLKFGEKDVEARHTAQL